MCLEASVFRRIISLVLRSVIVLPSAVVLHRAVVLSLIVLSFSSVGAQDTSPKPSPSTIQALSEVPQTTSQGAGQASVEIEQRVFEIARKLRCPVCRAESAADSSSTPSVEFRNIIQEQLEAGKSEKEVIAYFQERYGDWILLSPPKRGVHLLVWLLPLIAALLGLVTLLLLFRRWTKRSREPKDISQEDAALVKAALESEH